ncbi:hypothetical protein [Devosia sp.]|uniref:hypothetical protein n=1 Tax=Devosia sp. TaxID=1871048 RepID=UPI001AFE83F9|nr:hypothetical protein [Devosia sp.]MBO9589585.1 hypothetical protein [Devosia sp.]
MGAENPKAWVLAPVEPTAAMVEAHYRAHAEAETVFADAQAVWAAMIACAPNHIPDAGEMVESLQRGVQEHVPYEGHWNIGDADKLMLQAAALITSQEAEIERLAKERDDASADAYKANKAADAINAALKETGERAAKNWRDFRDLRIEITGDGPMCRDCADENGRCPHSGQPCDPDEAVEEQIAKWKAEGFRDKIALGATAEEILRFRDGYPNPAGGSKIFYRYTIEQARYRYADAVIAARSTTKEKGNG